MLFGGSAIFVRSSRSADSGYGGEIGDHETIPAIVLLDLILLQHRDGGMSTSLCWNARGGGGGSPVVCRTGATEWEIPIGQRAQS